MVSTQRQRHTGQGTYSNSETDTTVVKGKTVMDPNFWTVA